METGLISGAPALVRQTLAGYLGEVLLGDDITVGILRSIRDEIRETRTELSARIDEVAKRVGSVEGRLESVDGRVESLERRQTATEMRLATELLAVVRAIHEVRDILRESLALAPKVADHEQRIRALEARSGGGE